jgi:hypothetical protein
MSENVELAVGLRGWGVTEPIFDSARLTAPRGVSAQLPLLSRGQKSGKVLEDDLTAETEKPAGHA